MTEEKKGTTDWKDVAVEQAKALGISQHELIKAVEHELISRAAFKIADEWKPPGRGSRLRLPPVYRYR